MAKQRPAVAIRHMRTLFAMGAVGGQSDVRLLDQFSTGHREAAEAAFATLVERHGPMVLRVCRGVLGSSPDVHDAFQATFLVLVRRAHSLWVRDSVGPWLHSVAVRVANKAKVAEARRKVHERRCAEIADAVRGGSTPPDDLSPTLHDEIERLPGKYRAPIVLCYLEGQTHEGAAAVLGWPVGTVGCRLARGRALLRTRLVRRGVGLSAGASAALLSAGEVSAAALSESLVRAVMSLVAERSAGVAPAAVKALAEASLRLMTVAKLKIASILVLIGLFALGLAVAAGSRFSDSRQEAAAQPAAPKVSTARRDTGAQPAPTSQAAAVSGLVVDAGGKPAVGVDVLLSGLGRAAGRRPVLSRAKTDQEGRFSIDVPVEKDPEGFNYRALWAYTPKAGLAGQAFLRDELPAAGSVQLKLGGTASTSVRVLEPDGKPVAGARVIPLWVRVRGGLKPVSTFTPPDSLADALAATTDSDGKGQINGCKAEDVDVVWVEAAGFGRQGSELSADAGGARVITLKPAGRLFGRVQADDPSAKRGLEVIAMTLPLTKGDLRIAGDGRATTDAEGRFEITALAAGKLSVNVLPADGAKLRPKLPTDLTIEPGKTTEVTISLEAPPRQRTLAGRVVDRRGQPVAGATVFQSGDSPARTEALTAANGRFELNDVVARPTFLFVRKPGYRFGGLAIAAESEELTLAIHKLDEPPRQMRKTLPPLLSHPEEVALARRLLDPYAELVLKQGAEPEKVRTIEALARIEPERVLELIQQKKAFTAPFFNGMFGLQVAMGMLDESVDEALAVLEGLEDPGSKAIGYIKASEKVGAGNRVKALEVLDRALLNARAAREPDGIRLLLMGWVAEQFLDLGQAERGRAILREGEALAKQLPKAGWVAYAKGAFAEELVQIDQEAALALTKDLSDAREFDRHHGNIAHELGGRDPAQAERVLAMVKDQFQREHYTVRVVYRMAPLDLARALRLAESIGDDGLKGYAMGMAALGLSEAGKDRAREVLENAYASLERSSGAGQLKPSETYHLTSIAAALLPVAERVDAGLVDEYLWRSLALRAPKPWETAPADRTAEADVQLAMMLARYDRAIARSLLEPLALGSGPARAYVSMRGELHAAAAGIDPKWAVALVEALPDDPDLKLQRPKNAARLAVTTVLGRTGDRRFRKLESSFISLWLPDIEDANPYD
jgi:RNA polymerase sigma factor (sigma-70 family)